jgi:hypothetical protein
MSVTSLAGRNERSFALKVASVQAAAKAFANGMFSLGRKRLLKLNKNQPALELYERRRQMDQGAGRINADTPEKE